MVFLYICLHHSPATRALTITILLCVANEQDAEKLKKEKALKAYEDAKNAASFAPEYAKAHHRMAKALEVLDREEEAKASSSDKLRSRLFYSPLPIH